MSPPNNGQDQDSVLRDDEPPYSGTRIWRDEPNAGSFPLTEFARRSFISFRPLTYYSFYLNDKDSNALDAEVRREPDSFTPLPGPVPAHLNAAPATAPFILSPSAPVLALKHGIEYALPSQHLYGAVRPSADAASVIRTPLPASRFGNIGSAAAPPRIPRGEYYKVETWVHEDDLVVIRRGNYTKGSFSCYKSNKQVESPRLADHKARGERRVRLFISEWEHENRIRVARGQAPIPPKKKQKDKQWLKKAREISNKEAAKFDGGSMGERMEGSSGARSAVTQAKNENCDESYDDDGDTDVYEDAYEDFYEDE